MPYRLSLFGGALSGHILAFMSVFFWSALYVSTKILLEYLSAFELLLLQFIAGYILLFILKPKILKISFKEELLFALAGLFGMSIYNLFLNLAMEQTYASNVSVIIATAPLFTGIFAFLLRLEKPYCNFFLGFCLCIIGVLCLTFGSGGEFGLSLSGDILALISAMGWGAYSVVIVYIMKKNYDILLATRKMIFYGILFMIPAFWLFPFSPKWESFSDPIVSFNFIFVAIFASGFCFVMWNKATLLIGAVKTNIYVYLTPIITIIVAMIVLGESIGLLGGAGIALTIIGVIIGEWRR